MKHTTSIRLAAFTLTLSALFLSGCQSSPQPEREIPAPQDTTGDAPKPSQTPAPSAAPTKHPADTGASRAYTDPSEADTYCSAIEDLITLNEEAGEEDEGETVKGLGKRLDLLVAGSENIGRLAPNEGAEKGWDAMSGDYEKAADLFKSSGNQVSNTDFLLLLSNATTTANKTYEHQSKQIEASCGVDITQLIAEKK